MWVPAAASGLHQAEFSAESNDEMWRKHLFRLFKGTGERWDSGRDFRVTARELGLVHLGQGSSAEGQIRRDSASEEQCGVRGEIPERTPDLPEIVP